MVESNARKLATMCMMCMMESESTSIGIVGQQRTFRAFIVFSDRATSQQFSFVCTT